MFRQGPAPTRADLATVAARVEKRMIRWLRRRGLVDERAAEDRSNEAPELSPLEACMQLSLVDSASLRLAEGGRARAVRPHGAPTRRGGAAPRPPGKSTDSRRTTPAAPGQPRGQPDRLETPVGAHGADRAMGKVVVGRRRAVSATWDEAGREGGDVEEEGGFDGSWLDPVRSRKWLDICPAIIAGFRRRERGGVGPWRAACRYRIPRKPFISRSTSSRLVIQT